MQEHLTYMTSLAEQLREIKEEISSKKFATVVLGSLPESYDNFLTSLNARNAADLDWENVKGLLIEEFLKRAEKSEKQEAGNALYVNKRASTEENIKHVVQPVVVAVFVFGRKTLRLAMIIRETSKESHASNVSGMGTW